jgi:thioredoxin 2
MPPSSGLRPFSAMNKNRYGDSYRHSTMQTNTAKTRLIICPQCLAQNKVPDYRLVAQPKCGKCRAALFAGHPLDLTEHSFDRHLLKSDAPLLVDFWAPWCGPCRMMAPQFAQAAQILEPTVRLGKINTEQETVLANRFAIRSIPTLKLFLNGKEIASQAGAMDTKSIVSWVQSQL